MLANRIKKNLQRLKGYLKDNNISCFRVYDRDIPELPYQIDYYEEYTIVFERGRRDIDDTTRQKSQDLIHQELIGLERDPNKIIFKQRQIQKDGSQYEQLKKTNKKLEIQERHNKFYINPYDYLDVGLFLDHRPLRRMLTKTSSKRSLNLFCYTGSISVVLAKTGSKVINVDMSATYINWTKDNFRLNEIALDRHKFIQQDVFQYLDECRANFDIIILDPPAVSKSKRMKGTLDIQRDHDFLIEKCMNLLSSNGVLYFSNNLRSFKLNQELNTKFKINDITEESIPMDFKDKKIHQCYKISHE